jgi:hypothetical protein
VLTATYPDTSHYRAIFVQQYRNVLGFGTTRFAGQSNSTSVSESLTTTRANSVVAVPFDIGFMTGMAQTGGLPASEDVSFSDYTHGWGLFLWDSPVTKGRIEQLDMEPERRCINLSILGHRVDGRLKSNKIDRGYEIGNQ